jgi:Trk K+ transport system NAD-binding subunit
MDFMKTETPLTNHFVICGLGHVGYRIVELLHQIGETFVVVTRDVRPEWREIVEERAARFIIGDARLASCLQSAMVQSARAVIVVTDHDLINIEIALDIRRSSPEIPMIVRIFDRFLAHRVEREMHVRKVLSPALLTAPVFVAAARGEEMIRAFEIAGVRLNVCQVAIANVTASVGSSVGDFCDQHRLIALSLIRSGREDGPVDREEILQEDDRIVVMATADATDRLRKGGLLPRRETLTERNRPWRRLWRALKHPHYPFRTLYNIWRRASGILRFAFVALHILFLTSVLVFHHYLPGRPSWVDSIYFTVTMMTTVGFGDYSLRYSYWWLKLYGCLVMIAGAALVAIVFSLVTDYIVSSRVEQALGRRKTPLEDHIVVIGLGDVGTRVAEELHRVGEGVVAIERDADHEAVPGLQDHIQVIIADANRESAMNQANFSHARAVIVTTTDDLVSLRIAHQAETLNPRLRTVVRIYDSSLADKLGRGLGIDRAVNAAQTAAATFVACALDAGVEESYMLGTRLIAIIRTTEVQPRGAVVLAGLAEDALVLREYDPHLRRWMVPACRFTNRMG